MGLLTKQNLFVSMVAQLLIKAQEMGYQVSFGEAYRPKELAALYAAQGKGIQKSLHSVRLAIDLNLFRNGTYLDKTEDHRPLGEWWESIGGTWGGRFNDGNHYSLSHDGRR